MAESWVKVAAAPDESDALLMEGVLKDAGIPSLIQRARGFDVPDFLSAGPRDVLVPNSLVEEARQVLQDTTGLGSYVP
jgi:predicted esterase